MFSNILNILRERSNSCDIYTIDKENYVFIRQPRTESGFDPSNRVSGVLIYDRLEPVFTVNRNIRPIVQNELGDLGEKVEEALATSDIGSSPLAKLADAFPSYYPRIALLPAEGATNVGLLNLLRNYPALGAELVDPIELGLGEARKIRKNVSRSHRTSLLARAFMQNREILRAAKQVQEQIDEETSLVRLYCKEDASHLPVLCQQLKQMGLIRPSVMKAVEYTVEQFCLNMSHDAVPDDREMMQRKISGLISNGMHPS